MVFSQSIMHNDFEMGSLLSLLFLLILLAVFGHSVILPTNLECTFNEEVCATSFCLLSKGRGIHKYLSIGCNFNRTISAATLHVELLRRSKLGDYKSTKLRMITDVCDLKNAKGGNGIINSVLSLNMQHLSSLRCPLRGNMTVKRLPLMLFVAEGFFPDAEYKLFVKVFNPSIYVFKMNITILVNSAKL